MTNPTTESAATAKAAPSRTARKASRRQGKKKLVAKLRSDREFAKGYFEGKSKRANDKKAKFRKKKSGKK